METLTRGRRRSSERGAELIEMVLVTPLFLLLAFGIVDFGFMFQRYIVLTNAAMEGARVGILPGYSAANAEARARSYASQSGVPGTVTAVATTPVGTPFLNVRVSHFYNYQYLGPIAAMFGGSFTSVSLRASSSMRKQIP